MTVEEVIKHFGNAAKAARALGLNDNHVRVWKHRGYVPILQQYRVQSLTGGKLKVGDDPKEKK